MNFKEMGLREELLRAVEDRGYTKPTAIQSGSIPAILKGRDVLGGAQTGTGKTAAFALPLLQRLSEKRGGRNPRVLVLTPTRELAQQVGESFSEYGAHLSLRTQIVFGGVNIKPQIARFKQGCDILVATPGRLLDHTAQKTVTLSQLQTLVLDEADRMLDMGFIHDIKRVLKLLPSQRQNLLFSATYGKEIRTLAEGLLKDPVSVEVTPRNSTAEKVEQCLYRMEQRQKRHLLAHLIQAEGWYQALVFVRTKHGANRLARQLDRKGIPSAAIHGDKSQNARIRALEDFRSGKLQTLIATDVAARGIHLEGLSHVVNFDLPRNPEDYIHRIGRTGRAGKSGIAVSLVSADEADLLRKIERLAKNRITERTSESFVPVAPAEQDGRPQGGRAKNSGTRAGRPTGNGALSEGRRTAPGRERAAGESVSGRPPRRKRRPAGGEQKHSSRSPFPKRTR